MSNEREHTWVTVIVLLVVFIGTVMFTSIREASNSSNGRMVHRDEDSLEGTFVRLLDGKEVEVVFAGEAQTVTTWEIAFGKLVAPIDHPKRTYRYWIRELSDATVVIACPDTSTSPAECLVKSAQPELESGDKISPW